MQISGVLLQVRPEQAQSVRECIARIAGTEVHAITADGRIVLTVEREHGQELAQTLQQMTDIPGVLASALVYHYFDSDDTQEA